MDGSVLELLIREHQAAVYRYVCYLGAQLASAEDYVQETVLRAYRAADTPDPANAGAWRAWLRTVARNLVLTDRRRGDLVAFDQAVVERAEAAWAQVVGDGDGDEQLAALRACLENLPARQREAVEHRYARGAGRAEMARLLGLSEDGVKMLLRRIRSALARCVEDRISGRKELLQTRVRP